MYVASEQELNAVFTLTGGNTDRNELYENCSFWQCLATLDVDARLSVSVDRLPASLMFEITFTVVLSSFFHDFTLYWLNEKTSPSNVNATLVCRMIVYCHIINVKRTG